MLLTPQINENTDLEKSLQGQKRLSVKYHALCDFDLPKISNPASFSVKKLKFFTD